MSTFHIVTQWRIWRRLLSPASLTDTGHHARQSQWGIFLSPRPFPKHEGAGLPEPGDDLVCGNRRDVVRTRSRICGRASSGACRSAPTPKAVS